MDGPLAPRSPDPPLRPAVQRYAAAVACVGIGLVSALWVQGVMDAAVPLLIAVLMAAWFNGLWPALLASFLAVVADDFFFSPPLYTLTPELSHLPHLTAFVLLAVFFATMSASRRRAEYLLKRARNEMEARVIERTAELRQSNIQLQAEIVERRRAEQALEDLAGRLIHAQEQERSRIGRELHDHISQTLGVLTIKIDQLRANGAVTPEVGAALDEARRDATEITDDVHRLSHRLHSSTLDFLGLVPALQKLVAEFAERHHISIGFSYASLPPSLPSEISLCLFRVVEEGLTNIAKHSQARLGQVHVRGADDGIHLMVQDSGTGFDAAGTTSRGGLGFVSMRERLRVLHGTVRVKSAPAEGTRIDVWIPASSLQASALAEDDQGAAYSRVTPS
jgi:signal transduction histidine kinase